MPRAPFQVLILPFRKIDDSFQFALFCRADDKCWQAVAGGGEAGETPLEAARREAFEEAGISPGAEFIALDSVCSIPVIHFRESEAWGKDVFVIPEHSFGVNCTKQKIILSNEHIRMLWLPYSEALEKFTYDSNRTALWELNQKLHARSPESERRD
jgi:dihydroneopterin triphosphate diphosphatase